VTPTRGENGRHALLALSLVSGLGGVVYEVLYMRHLVSVLGDMFYVHAALLGMFLLGNGIGAWLAHRFIRWLWAFEIAIGLYALVLPLLLTSYEFSAIGQTFADPTLQSLFASALLLAVPSTAIGISIPLFSEYVRARGGRDAFKSVYLLYNLGAALSVIVVDFVLIRRLGFTASLWVVGAGNLAVGLVLLARHRAWTPSAADERPPSEPLPRRHLAALLLASIASALFIALTIKACYHLFLPQRENFAICTSISVLAIALGTGLVRRFRVEFSTLLVLAMVTSLGIYAGIGWIVRAFHWFEDLVSTEFAGGFIEPSWTALPRELLFGLLLMVPYVFLGATIPALLRHEGDVARRAGTLLLVSGIGNAVGLSGFTLLVHPNMKIFTVPLLIWGLLSASLLLYGGFALGARRLVVLAVSLALLPVVGRQPESKLYLLHDPLPEDASVVHFKSASDNVSYVHTPDQSYIRFNGMPSIYIWGDPVEPASSGRANLAEAVSGVLPALVAPRLERALVVGMGSGITAGATAEMFEQTDIVEINAAFFPLVEQIGEYNFDVTRNPKATIIHDDGRRFLAATGEKYDAIINSVPSPTYFAAGKIYTSEFLDLVKGALAPGGVYSAWFSPPDMSAEGVHTMLATLADRFEHCNLAVLRIAYYFTTCSDEPLVVDADLDYPDSIRAAVEGVRGVTPREYFSSVVVSDDIFRGIDYGNTRLNTDDFPILEFQVMRLGRRERVADPVLVSPERFNLSIAAEDPERLLDRAVVLAQIHRVLFRRLYERYLQAHPALGQEYNRRMAELFPRG
jgi:predicted membrane-bound spermidine synthase